jgi:hypothetical protein
MVLSGDNMFHGSILEMIFIYNQAVSIVEWKLTGHLVPHRVVSKRWQKQWDSKRERIDEFHEDGFNSSKNPLVRHRAIVTIQRQGPIRLHRVDIGMFVRVLVISSVHVLELVGHLTIDAPKHARQIFHAIGISACFMSELAFICSVYPEFDDIMKEWGGFPSDTRHARTLHGPICRGCKVRRTVAWECFPRSGVRYIDRWCEACATSSGGVTRRRLTASHIPSNTHKTQEMYVYTTRWGLDHMKFD